MQCDLNQTTIPDPLLFFSCGIDDPLQGSIISESDDSNDEFVNSTGKLGISDFAGRHGPIRTWIADASSTGHPMFTRSQLTTLTVLYACFESIVAWEQHTP